MYGALLPRDGRSIAARRSPKNPAPTTVPTLPIGVPTRSFRQPVRNALATAAGLGADGVELDLRNEVRSAEFTQTALRQFRRLLEDQRLKTLTTVFPTRRPLGDPQGLERRVLAIRDAMSFAYTIGARVLVVRVGGPSDNPEHRSLAEALGLLGAHGERVGVRLAIASGDSPDAQHALLARLDEGVVGVSLCPPLLIGGGHEPAEAAATLGPHVLHLRATDAVRDASAPAGAAEVELGRGEADPPALLATLEEHGYRGPITVDRTAGADPAGDIANAIAYLRAL